MVLLMKNLLKPLLLVGAEGAFVCTRFNLSKENPACDIVKKKKKKKKKKILWKLILMILLFFFFFLLTWMDFQNGALTSHTVGKVGLEANKREDINPASWWFLWRANYR